MKKSNKSSSSNWVFLSYLCIIVASYFAFHILPLPVESTDKMVFSEGNVLKDVKVLAADIGMRLVGTKQEDQTISYIIDRINDIKRNANNPVQVFRQQSNGSHLFELMGEECIKLYSNITNIIVRLTCDECSRDAILLNSHFDSTIVTPGAADDSAGVGIMLEILRLQSQKRDLKKSILFLFNGAEESLQDGSHAFVKSSPLAKDVRLVLNLEAMGSMGKEILFQSNSPYLTSVYKKAKRPHASSLSNFIFSTGLIMSDTDFRQFVKYGNYIGLDFAIYQNSYNYHTNLDTVENIQPGTIQHFGDNIMSIVDELVSAEEEWNLENDSSMIYFDYLGLFFVFYDQSMAKLGHGVVILFALFAITLQRKALGLSLMDLAKESVLYLADLLAGIFSTVAFSVILGAFNSMSWFSSVLLPLCLFVPIFSQSVLYRSVFLKNTKIFENDRLERQQLVVGLIINLSLLAFTTVLEVGISFFCMLQCLSMTLCLMIDSVLEKGLVRKNISFLSYSALLPFIPFSLSTLLAVMYVFTPITGRIGSEAPVDIIMPIVTCFCLLPQVYIVSPLIYRISPSGRVKLMNRLRFASLALFILFLSMSPYTSKTPKRMYVSFLENRTSHSRGFHVAFSDNAKTFDVINHLSKEFGLGVKRTRDQSGSDWATLYPFSHFIENYYFDMNDDYSTPLTDISPLVSTETVFNRNGSRTIKISVDHEHFIWSVLSFHAKIYDWSLDMPVPKQGNAKYTLRHAGGYPSTTWNFTMTVEDKVSFELSGVERNGFQDLIPNSHSNGMDWIWSDRWESRSVLERIRNEVPKWTTAMLVSIVVSHHHSE